MLKGRTVRLFFAFVALACLCSCRLSSDKLDMERAQEAAAKNDYSKAYLHYKNIVDRGGSKDPMAIKAAEVAARVAQYELKKFKDAIEMYRFVILNSPDEKVRLEAEKKIAEIDFNNLLDYQQAIAEYSHLVELPHTPQEELLYQTAIARAYFYLNNFFQAQVEIDRVIKKVTDKASLFDALLLKANIFLTTKDLDQAISVLRKLMSDYPQKAAQENIGLVLAVSYEEQRNFAKAIEVLEEMKQTYPRKAFLESKIKALKERQGYLPGARGWRK